jgi:hypothetical protein
MKCKYETTGWYDGMKRCLGTKEVDPCPGYEKCQHFKPYRMTNADRIRAMTDEELAEHNVREGYEYTVDYDYDDNPVGEYTPCYRTTDGSIFWDVDSAVKYELTWLKQPYGGAEG